MVSLCAGAGERAWMLQQPAQIEQPQNTDRVSTRASGWEVLEPTEPQPFAARLFASMTDGVDANDRTLHIWYGFPWSR